MWIFFACIPAYQDFQQRESNEESRRDSAIEEIDDLSWVDPDNLPAGNSPCRQPVAMRIDYVADGDTFFAKEEGQSQREKVRIIGVDTPELGEQECYAEEATSFLRSLIDNKWVWLTFDGDCTDHFGRTLAYVHLGSGEMDFVERQLLRGGYAKALSFDNTDTFATLFADDESAARDNHIGGWGDCGW